LNNRPAKNGRNAAARPDAAASVRIEMATASEIDITKDRLGATLSARRHALGLRIEDISEDIKIRPEYLRALEQETLDRLPTPQHARLFLKAYAERLGLRVAEVYALHDLCEGPAPAVADAEVPMAIGSAMPDRRRLPRAWYFAGAAAVIVIVALLLLVRGGEEGVSNVASDTETVLPEPVVTSPPAQTANEPVPVEPMVLSLSFTRDTWARLIADGDTVVDGIMRGGQRTESRAQTRFQLSLGHMQGVDATVNGRPVPSLAHATGALAGLAITTDSVAAWFGGASAESTSAGNVSY
jgi:cytoskeleton protein RodZ